MTIRSIQEQLRCSFAGLALSTVPILMLIFTLVRSGHWRGALSALAGKYTAFGIPGNPWRDFLPSFLLAISVFIFFSWLAAMVARRSRPSPGKLLLSVLLNLPASVAFGISMELASISHLWFADYLVIGSPTSPILSWSSLCLSLVVLSANCYRLMLRHSDCLHT